MVLHSEIQGSPYDEEFGEMGIRISEIEAAGDRKMIPWDYVVESNPFVRCRLLFGPCAKADVAALLVIDKTMTATEIRNALNCSYETAYRGRKVLLAAGWPLLKLNPPTDEREYATYS